ncbi:hypothetical protein ACIQVS_40640, partial [Streptomyces vinaceus]
DPTPTPPHRRLPHRHRPGHQPTDPTLKPSVTAFGSSSKGFIATIAEQLRKYDVRFIGMTQMTLRLSAITRQALLRNQSWLSTCAADYDEAAFVAKRWNGHASPETITELP